MLADAILERDVRRLAAVRDACKRRAVAERERLLSPERVEVEGALAAIVSVCEQALDRLTRNATCAIERGSHAHVFLLEVARRPGISNSDLLAAMGAHEPEVSRAGRRLVERWLAVKRRFGWVNHWRLAPAGERALRALERQPASSRGAPRRHRGEA